MAGETPPGSDSAPIDARTDEPVDETAARRGVEGEAGQDEKTEARIRDRAYVISHGSDAGLPAENWLRAEREIAQEDAIALADQIAQRAKEAAFRAAMTHP